MEQEFEYGEPVEVRDDDDQQWVRATFIQKVVDVSYWTQEPGSPACGWEQIRKIQPDTENIEQRIDKFEAILKNAMAHINKQIESIENKIK